MQARASRAAGVGQRLAVQRPIVDALAAQGRSLFAEVDTHLMRSPRFQTALDQGEVAKIFEDGDVRDGSLPLAGPTGAAAATVTAIVYQVRLDAPRLRTTAHQGKVAALDRVRAKLSPQVTLGLGGAGEDYQTARFLVEPVDGADAPRPTIRLVGYQARQQIGERRRQKATAANAELRGFVSVPHRRQARRLVNDDNRGIDIIEDRLYPGCVSRGAFLPVLFWGGGGDGRLNFQGPAGTHAPGGFGTEAAVDPHSAIPYQVAYFHGGEAEVRLEERSDCAASLGSRDGNALGHRMESPRVATRGLQGCYGRTNRVSSRRLKNSTPSDSRSMKCTPSRYRAERIAMRTPST